MSKAFTKESEDEPMDGPPAPRASSSLPPGTPNYMTPAGAQRMRDELERLVRVERPALPEDAERGSEGWRQRRKLNARIAECEQILQSAEVVPPPVGADARMRVVFGATVTVRETSTGERSRYQIVGVDEAEFGGDRVSLHAPISRALINRQVGERVRFRFPAGEEELEIVAVEYE